jgi:hypothetical protein
MWDVRGVKESSKLFLSNIIMVHAMRFWEQPWKDPVNVEALGTGRNVTRQASQKTDFTSARSQGTRAGTGFTTGSGTTMTIRLFESTTTGQSNTSTGNLQICKTQAEE